MNQLPNEPIGTDKPEQPADEVVKSKWLTRKEYTDPAEKKRDFWRGVGLFFGLAILFSLCNTALPVALSTLSSTADGSNASLNNIIIGLFYVLLPLPWILTIGLMIYFGRTRTHVALGMLTGFSVILVLTLIAGVVTSVGCFVVSLSDPETAILMIIGQIVVGAALVPVLIVTGIVAVIFLANYRSSQEKSSLRMARFLGVILAIVFVLAFVLTIGYLIVQARAP